MEKEYFKLTEPNGEVYMQLRYYSPMSDDKCYEAVIIIKNKFGDVKEIVESYNKNDFNYFQNHFSTISADEFIVFQETYILGSVGARKNIYDTYYNQWKDYFLAKKQALANIKSTPNPFNYDYYYRLATEWVTTGVNARRDGLRQLEDSVKTHANVTQSDIYREAKHTATMDYVAERL